MASVKNLVAAKIKASIEASAEEEKKHPDIAAIVAASVVNAIAPKELDAGELPSEELAEAKSAGLNLDDMSADKQAYYAALAVRELQTIIETANFNLEGLMSQGKASINNMFFNRDGSADADAIIPLDMEPQEDYSKVEAAFDLKLRSEFEPFMQYSINLPTNTKPTASIALTLHLPAAMITSIGADKFDTRAKVLQKYLEGLFKKELG